MVGNRETLVFDPLSPSDALRGQRSAPIAMSGGCVFLLLLALLLLLAPPASAAQSRQYTNTTFGPDGIGGSQTFSSLRGIAVDQAKGFVYAYDGGESGGRIFKFSTTGAALNFTALKDNSIDEVGAAGPGESQIAVAPPGSPGGTAGDIYVATASTVKVFSEAGTELGTLGSGFTCGVAVGSSTGNLFIGSYEETINEYVPTTNPPTDGNLTATGSTGQGTGICNLAVDNAGGIYAANFSGSQIVKLDGISDAEPSNIEPGGPTLFVDPATDGLYADRGDGVVIYNSDGTLVGSFASEEVSQSLGVAVSDQAEKAFLSDGNGGIRIYGPLVIVPDVVTNGATGLTPDAATLNGTVSPNGLPLQKCFFEYGAGGFEESAPCSAPKASEVAVGGQNVAVHANVSGLDAHSDYQFRLVATTANGASKGNTQALTTPPPVVTEAASVGSDGVIFNGKVFPASGKVSVCKFEYKLVGSPSFTNSIDCNPSAAALPKDSIYHAVTAKPDDLNQAASYRFRLVATNSEGASAGETYEFETFGRPDIREPRAANADQQSVTLEATVNPRGSSGTYRFEWGNTSAYGNAASAVSVTPYFGTNLLRVRATIGGLTAATKYHFRLVANNQFGSTDSRDTLLETLNSCGLPDERCFEDVSERQSGSVASVLRVAAAKELHFQAGSQSGVLAYVVESGFPDATKGSEVVYRALRGPTGWKSNQLSAADKAQNITNDIIASPSSYRDLSEDLSCGVLASNQPLTSDPSTRFAVETGGANLYKDNMDGTYTALTTIAPANPNIVTDVPSAFKVFGTSSNCRKVVFSSNYNYPGLPASPAETLYEWDNGQLRTASLVPGTQGDEPGETEFDYNEGDVSRRVSGDGSRVIFTAVRKSSPNPDEIGDLGVFVREDGKLTRDVSLSETSTASAEANYQSASSDGSSVFFLADAGITPESSSEGRDLYRYDISSERLTDLSVDAEAGGAGVVGMVGASSDGTRVYFLATGELDPGHGESFAENISAGTYSLFVEKNSQISYIASIDKEQLLQTRFGAGQTARVTPDGRFFAFESSTDVTGYDAGPERKALYLFDADAVNEPVVCISCRRDGDVTANPPLARLLQIRANTGSNSLEAPRTLIERNGEPVVFFTSRDVLAPGAPVGLYSAYEWSHGQVFRLATESSGLQSRSELEIGKNLVSNVPILGANADGTDIYFGTAERLTWEDEDDRTSIYDARVGGGFPQLPMPPSPCNASAEGSCQGQLSSVDGSKSASTQDFHSVGQKRKRVRRRKRHHQRHSNEKKRHRHRSRPEGSKDPQIHVKHHGRRGA